MKHLLIAMLALLVAACQSTPPVSKSSTGPAAQDTRAAQPSKPVSDVPAAAPLWPEDNRFPGVGPISNWDRFPDHYRNLRAQFAERAAGEHHGLVFVGDSITEGWTPTQKQDLASLGIKIVNRGIGGDTTPTLLYRLQDDVLALQPRALVVLIGTNDIGSQASPADVAANMELIRTRIRAAFPDIPIAWCLVMPRGDHPHLLAPIRELNERIRELVKRDPRMTLCDTFSAFATPEGTDDQTKFTPDRLHLNERGYATWRDTILPILERWELGRAR